MATPGVTFPLQLIWLGQAPRLSGETGEPGTQQYEA